MLDTRRGTAHDRSPLDRRRTTELVLAAVVGIAALVGEVPFLFWLLIKGVDVPRWHEAATSSR